MYLYSKYQILWRRVGLYVLGSNTSFPRCVLQLLFKIISDSKSAFLVAFPAVPSQILKDVSNTTNQTVK